MIVPDANLLIYAYDQTSPQHPVASVWWRKTLAGAEPVGIPWVVVLAFIRLTTHPALSKNPSTVGEAKMAVRSWLAFDHVRLLVPREETLDRFFSLLDEVGFGGNIVTDAMIAAHALDYHATIYSADRDFDRFKALRWLNPLQR